eukprot:TRINITY_DN4947_c0_g2_i1.p1 TRINITY_DN4947_c0_g2~~TRINITY_DN4947_c0_g2_i1.p1  ORF type:complete len:648 (+),score=215.84 TRINITY_DN4947_c0_g2_i1:43-1986(+)
MRVAGMPTTMALVCALLAPVAQAVSVATAEHDLIVGKTDHVRVNALTSRKTWVPIDYYSLAFVKPKGGIETDTNLNLGQYLMGDRPENSPYLFRIGEDVSCAVMKEEGEAKTVNKEQIKQFADAIEDGYRINLLYENMDAWTNTDHSGCGFNSTPAFSKGVRVGGCVRDADEEAGTPKQYYLNTHLNIVIKYSTPSGTLDKDGKAPAGKIFVVGLTVGHVSRADGCATAEETAEALHPFTFNTDMESMQVKFSYSVTWQFENKKWASRWDDYVASYEVTESEARYKESIIYSILLGITLAVIVAMIIMRALHIDFNRYNNPDNPEEMQEEVGWKLVHTDVFRPPSHPNRFCGLLGTGVQMLGMCAAALGFSLIGFMSPGMRGILLFMCLFVFAVFAVINGYVCGVFQMSFGCKQWKTPILSGVVYPFFVFLLWSLTEIALASVRGATAEVDFSVFLQLMILWWGISIPLVILGAASAFKQEPMKPPIPYRQMPRPIPPQSWMFSKFSAVLIPGLISFVTFMFVLQQIYMSVWFGRVYILFGYVFVSSVLALITVAETTIVFIYYQLVYEDYRWWWKSFLCGSGIGWYSLLWGLWKLPTWGLGTKIAMWLYVVFVMIGSSMLMLCCGFIGFFVSWTFTRKIYNAIKIE